MIGLNEQTRAQSVAVVEFVRAVALHGVGDVLLERVLCDACVEQIAQGGPART